MGWQDAPEVGGSWQSAPIVGEEAPKAKVADPKIGQPQELTFAERHIAPVLEKLGFIEGARNVGVSRGGAVGRVAMGMADPGVAIAQVAANAVGAGDAVNSRIKDVEDQYQAERKAVGSEGFDPLRMVGNAAITAPIPMGAAMKAASAGTKLVARGAAQGAVSGGLNPVVDGGENFWTDKGEQVGMGAIGGAVVSPLAGALARIASPKASINPDVALLRSEGVRPTIGQAAGGWANILEEKLTSVPILGDAIAHARRGAMDQFNTAAIARALQPVGGKASGVGNEAIAEAGDQISGAYQKALGSIKGVNLAERPFISKLDELEQMATGLSEPMKRVWDRELGEVMRKVSPNGSVLASDLKAVDSRLGKIAADYRGASDPTQRELGDAVKQLQAIFKEQVGRQHPEVAAALKNADSAWAQLVRVENAGKKAMNRDGVFTPAQYNMAVREGDKSVRKRATARGEALGQDLGSAAQNVLGNKYPDSGTPGRLLSAMGTIGSAAVHPAIPVGLTIAAGAYTSPVQNALVQLLTRRPDMAPKVANYLRQAALPASFAAGGMLAE